ncbi:MAG TPA: ribose-phosphate pyrophosphokinase, partial [Pseudomonas sp.]|nr:ribose-phosphate pyrophosphokinase [Pseudomonas sp.]
TGGELFDSGAFERVLVADSIAPFRLPVRCLEQLDIVDTSALVAELIANRPGSGA